MIKLDCISTCSNNHNTTELILDKNGIIFAQKNSGTDKDYHHPNKSPHGLRTRIIGYVQRESPKPEGSYSAPIIPENFSTEPLIGYSPIIIERPSTSHVENLRIVSIDRQFNPFILNSQKRKP